MEALLGPGSEQVEDLLDDEALPRGAHLGIRKEACSRGESRQRIENFRVTEVDLGSAHLTLADILEAGPKLTNRESRRQEIEVARHGRVGDTESTLDLGAIPEPSQ